MGAECSVERHQSFADKEILKTNSFNNTQENTITSFDFKSYKDYNAKMEILKVKLNEMIKKIINKTDIVLTIGNITERIENSYHSNMETVRIEKLFEIALLIYREIGSVFGNSLNFPKQELSKINYSLISRYLAYEEDEENDTEHITKKIIKRINFFSEEFPFKLVKLDKIIQSKKIFAFGYDIYNRITIYIRPYYVEKKLNKGINYLDNNLTINLEKIDYIAYIFFLIEHIQPVLKNKFNFSDQLNIILDFDLQNADTELIRFIMYYFNSYYPLILGIINVVNFEVNNLKKNIAFRNELNALDYFNVIFYYLEYYFS